MNTNEKEETFEESLSKLPTDILQKLYDVSVSEVFKYFIELEKRKEREEK